ncbi:MAG TPA: hypothetical protein PK090_12600, partial [Smithellaceae bacterium]|nr:hypothetical protein [Smithellaceae bacterium]
MVLSAPEGAIMGRLLVRRGDQVARGAELARLRDYDAQAAAMHCARRDIHLARAGLTLVQKGERPEQVEAQKAVVAARKAALRMHKAKKERYQQLHAKSIVPDDAYEAVLYDFEAAQADLLREKNVLEGMFSGHKEEIRQASAKVAVAEANYRQAMALLEA